MLNLSFCRSWFAPFRWPNVLIDRTSNLCINSHVPIQRHKSQPDEETIPTRDGKVGFGRCLATEGNAHQKRACIGKGKKRKKQIELPVLVTAKSNKRKEQGIAQADAGDGSDQSGVDGHISIDSH